MPFDTSQQGETPPDGPREGSLDAQLSLGGMPQPVAEIVKRDGQTASFSALKIAESIRRAGATTGEIDQNTSLSLASAVALYLASSPQESNESAIVVDEVAGVVERVLCEMGYERTAVAFSRHREAQRPLEHGEGASDIPYLLRAHGHQDMAGLVAELITATGLDGKRADTIRDAVVQRVTALGLSELGEPLVRELLMVTLDEHGFSAYAERFREVRVPISEVEEIVSGTDAVGEQFTPGIVETSSNLAERVKQEFALAKVYERAVADAHRRGDIFVHDLGGVDRIALLEAPLERIKRFGMETPDPGRRSQPAKDIETLIAQLGGQSSLLGPFVRDAVRWDALNFSLAPYVYRLEQVELSDVAKTLLYEFAFRGLSLWEGGGRAEFHLYWDMPEHMYGDELVGPGGALTERTCENYIDVARTFLEAFVVEYGRVHADLGAALLPLLVVHLTPASLSQAALARCLQRVGEAVCLGAPVRVQCAPSSPFLPDVGELHRSSDSVASRVSINLPRAARRSQNARALTAELDRGLETAIRAHRNKLASLERLMRHPGRGPLALLSRQRNGAPLLDLSRSRFVVGVSGLNECVRTLTGQNLHESTEAMNLGDSILGHMTDQCRQWGGELGMDVGLEATGDREVLQRFARMDATLFGAAPRDQIASGDRGVAAYSPGVSPPVEAALSPMERVHIEGRFHRYFQSHPACHMSLADEEMSANGVAHLLEKAFLQSSSRGVAFE